MDSRHEDWVPPGSFDEYRLVQALGRGSMGQVWLAHDTVLDRLVAVKFIAEQPGHDTARQRFLTEARAAARVQHPNIIAVYRVGEVGSRPYLISEYVRGESLDQVARPVAWPRLREVALGLARGLAAAHRQGVLHCDLQPANAIISETGEVKLLDFGLARLIPYGTPPDAAESRICEVAGARLELPGDPTIEPAAGRDVLVGPGEPHTTTAEAASGVASGALSRRPGGSIAVPVGVPPIWASGSPSVDRSSAVMGTPGYMPPEGWRGEPATPRWDVYSLGALLYALGAGAPPHRGASPEAVREPVLARDAPPLASVVPGIDPGFARVVDRCLRRDPAERFASGDEVREALEALSGDETAKRSIVRPLPRPLPSRARWLLFAGATLALLALFASFLFGGDHAHLPAAAALAAGPHPTVAAPGRCPEGMVRVPAGTFWMGSAEGDLDEQPQHEVTLSAYCIDRTEVTVAAYAECAAAKGCNAASQTTNWTNLSAELKRVERWCNGEDRPDHPINCVDWDQAATYCAWKGKRLPTEAEWEYAARGGDGRVYPWGKAAPGVKRLNACGNECVAMMERASLSVGPMYDGNDGWETTAPVGSYPEGASPFGALDMAGNVAEWTADWYGPYATLAETNPRGPSTGRSRVARGGGWTIGLTEKVRAADRDWPDPMVRSIDLGFRCAR